MPLWEYAFGPPVLAGAALRVSDAAPVVLQLTPGIKPWIVQRLTHDIPRYRGVRIGDRVRLADTDLLIEVNPRHVRFYQRMLGFRQLGPERACPRVGGAPAVLLWLRLKHAHEQIELYGGHQDKYAEARSLYPFFFAPQEEDGIVGRLTPAGTGGTRSQSRRIATSREKLILDERRKASGAEIGRIPVDSIYSPVLKVTYTRVPNTPVAPTVAGIMTVDSKKFAGAARPSLSVVAKAPASAALKAW